MSAQAAEQQVPVGSNSVESIIKELIDINSEIFELKEEIVAKGIPFNTLNALVELKTVGKPEELQTLRKSALQTAISQYGMGGIKPEALDNHMVKLVELEEDLAHIRKLAKGHNMEPQAVNLVTSIIRQNPGDSGAKVITKIVEYAGALGIKVSAAELVANDDDPPAPVSVLPNIVIAQPDSHGWRRYKKRGIEIFLGLLFAAVSISLLT